MVASRARQTVLLLAAFAMGCLATTCAIAATATVSWTMPTQNTDGSAIPTGGTGSIDFTRIQIGTCNGTGFGTVIGEVIVPAPNVSTTISDVEPGTYCFRAFVTNTYGSESAASNVASKIFDAVVPRPPVLKTIVGATAYELRMKGSGEYRLARNVGIVEVYTDCGELMIPPSYAIVPRTAVNFYRLSRTDLIVASCLAG